MTRKLLAVSIILMLALTVVPVVFAAPAGQDGDVDAVSGDTTDSGDTDDDDAGDTDDDDTGDADDDDAGDVDDDEAGDTNGDDDDAGDTDGDPAAGQHPVVARIALQLGITYDEAWAIFREGFTYEDVNYDGVVGLGRIMMAVKMEQQLQNLDWSWQEVLAWHLGDNGGWGSLKVADEMAAAGTGDAEELLALREDGCSWGHIRKGTCESDEDSGLGKAKDKEKKKEKKDKDGSSDEHVPPGQAKKSQDQDKDQDKDQDGLTGEHVPPGQAKKSQGTEEDEDGLLADLFGKDRGKGKNK